MTASEHDSGTFVFADIAGYTALTEAHGDADAADLAATFCREVSDMRARSTGSAHSTVPAAS